MELKLPRIHIRRISYFHIIQQLQHAIQPAKVLTRVSLRYIGEQQSTVVALLNSPTHNRTYSLIHTGRQRNWPRNTGTWLDLERNPILYCIPSLCCAIAFRQEEPKHKKSSSSSSSATRHWATDKIHTDCVLLFYRNNIATIYVWIDQY